MLSDRLVRTGLRLSGLMVLAIGLSHFAMPNLGYTPDAIAAVPDAQRDHFVYLGTYAIGTFLVSLAVMTFFADPTSSNALHRTFLGLMVAVWGTRLVLELIYPVTLSLFFLFDPHPVLLVAILLIWAGYILAFTASLLHSEHEKDFR